MNTVLVKRFLNSLRNQATNLIISLINQYHLLILFQGITGTTPDRAR